MSIKGKKIKLSITTLSIRETRLLTSKELTGGISTAAFANGVGLPVRIVLGRVSLLFSFMTPATRKYIKASIVAQEKHDSIKLLSQGKLDNMANIISQVMQDGHIPPTEFHRIVQEKEKYTKLKVDINNQGMVKIKKIKTEQREKILGQRRKEGEEILQVSRASMPFKI